MLRLPFLEDTTPPPFYRAELSAARRRELDRYFIGERSQSYYLKRFAQMDAIGKLSPAWNWAAFAATFGWLLYRKRYLDCFVYCVAGWSFIKVTIVLTLALLEFCCIGGLPEPWRWPVRIVVGAGIWLFWALQVGRWADAYYYRMARREIADALDCYPGDVAAQKAHLKQHGATSLVGLLVAFGLFLVLLAVVAQQFMPMLAHKKQQALIAGGYQAIIHAKTRVESIYQQRGCPWGMALASSQQPFTLVVAQPAGITSDCAVILTFDKAGYPVRYLNGQTLVLYRMAGAKGWRCQSSLDKKALPVTCSN